MWKKILPLFFLLFLSVILIYEAIFDTPTYDEPANMAASFDYVYRNDFRIYPDNPPLIKMFSGLALFPIKDKINFPAHLEIYQNPEKFDLYAFGRKFLYRSGNDTRAIMFFTRLPNILITIALGILLYFFAKDLYGQNAGLLALFLYSLDPNVRGHGHILAFDLPLAFVIVLILFLTYRIIKSTFNNKNKQVFNEHGIISEDRIRNFVLRLAKNNKKHDTEKDLKTIPYEASRPCERRNFACEYKAIFFILFSFLFALGFLTKFTFLFFAVIYLVGLFIFYFRKFTIYYLLFTISVSFLLLWLFGLVTNYNKITLDYDKVPIIASANEKLRSNIVWNTIKALPVPYYYKAGIETMYTHNLISQPAFLLGEVRARNDWFFYFPVSFLLKVPIPTLILIFLSIIFFIQKKLAFAKHDKILEDRIRNLVPNIDKSSNKHDKDNDLKTPYYETSQSCEQENFAGEQKAVNSRTCKLELVISYSPFVIGLIFFFCLMLFSHINNVFRYLFPSYVLFILGASQIVNSFDHKNSLLKIFFILNTAYLILNTIFSFPYDLSYTNELTGIPPAGYKYLSDSEVDWGQDLERLGKWLEKNGYDRETITLSYLGTADPTYYGIKYKPLQFADLDKLSGIVAISVGNLTLGDWQVTSRPDYKLGLIKAPLDFLRSQKPETVIGKSIFIYRFNNNL